MEKIRGQYASIISTIVDENNVATAFEGQYASIISTIVDIHSKQGQCSGASMLQ